MRKNVSISCKHCGEKWKPFTVTITKFIDNHIQKHELAEPSFEGDYHNSKQVLKFLRVRLKWKHKHFNDSRPDSDFII